MADQTSTNSDEIDLGQLFQLIGKVFNKLFRGFLGFYLYLKKNVFILGGLIILGIAVGYALNQVTTDLMKAEVIVKPNIDSRSYLYEVVNEIQANIDAKDIKFFKDLGIDVKNLKGFEIIVEPLVDTSNNDSDQQKEYLELLTEFGVPSEDASEDASSEAILDIVLAEILNKSTLFNHKISFYFVDPVIGQDYAQKLMTYINSTPYFNDLVDVYNENALKRIKKNTELVTQVDALISSYTEKLAQKDNPISDGKISFSSEENIDIAEIFEIKNDLIKDIEDKEIELKTVTEPIKIINFGKSQEVKKALYGRSIVFIPLVLMGLFFLISIIKYLNRKAKEM